MRKSQDRPKTSLSKTELPGRHREYSTQELSEHTWADFEELFLKRGVVGDGWWCWCTHHHVSSYSLPENQQPRTRPERAAKNREKKRDLVSKGCAHGILVYADGKPVGWCQYGSRQELPRMDHTRNYHSVSDQNPSAGLWRITCFVVAEGFRQKGVASAGLKAAIGAIRKKGGGLVEGYPVSETDQGSNYLYCGTVKMFEKEGFKKISPLATGRTATVVMRREV